MMRERERTRSDRSAGQGQSRDELADELLKRVGEAHAKKDSYGKFGSYIKDEYQELLWSCQGDAKGLDHLIDIVPYKAGPDHPELEEGKPAFMLDVYTHSKIGPNEDNFICMARMYNKPCPICEDQRQKRRDGAEDDELKLLTPKRRTLYNIIVYDSDKEIQKGVQLWDVAQWFMDKELSARSKNSRTGEFINYAHPDKKIGKSISFQRKGTGQFNTEFNAITFVDREESLTKEDLEQALPLDQVINIPSYEEVYEAHFGKAPESGKPAEPAGREGKGERQDPPTTGRRTETRREEKAAECPGGGEIGKDIGGFKECDDCKLWDDCKDEEKKLADKTPPERTPVGRGTSRRDLSSKTEREKRPRGRLSRQDDDIPF